METPHTRSDSYVVVEQRIHRGELGLSELEHLLDELVEQKKITPAEQQGLLELAWGWNVNPSTFQQTDGRKQEQ